MVKFFYNKKGCYYPARELFSDHYRNNKHSIMLFSNFSSGKLMLGWPRIYEIRKKCNKDDHIDHNLR